MLYGYFRKACHPKYRFDSSDEVRLAYLLDRDESVEYWLRPAPNQFDGLYWRDEQGDSSHRYEPDFVVELKNEIVMIEVKPEIEINASKRASKKTNRRKILRNGEQKYRQIRDHKTLALRNHPHRKNHNPFHNIGIIKRLINQ